MFSRHSAIVELRTLNYDCLLPLRERFNRPPRAQQLNCTLKVPVAPTIFVSRSVGRSVDRRIICILSPPCPPPVFLHPSFPHLPSAHPISPSLAFSYSGFRMQPSLATWAMFLGRLSSRRNPHFSARVKNWGRIPFMRNESERRSPPLPRPPPIRDHPHMTSAMGGTTKEDEVRRLRELYCVDQYQMWTWGRGLIIQKNCRRHI